MQQARAAGGVVEVDGYLDGAGDDTPRRFGHLVRVYFMRADKVATARRQVADASGKDQAVQALLSGPNDFERSIGMSTDIPAGTKLLGINVTDGTATADLSNDFQSGASATQPRVAEVVFTLTQFDDVRQVTITLNGKPIEGAVNLKRADLDAVTPKILVESPAPGESVTSPLKVSGAANVFEGTVSYSVNAPDGTELYHGFTTATQQVWGGGTPSPSRPPIRRNNAVAATSSSGKPA